RAVAQLQERRAIASDVVARLGALDLDHLGAEVAQDLGGPRRGDHPAKVQDADSREGQGHFSATFAMSSIASSVILRKVTPVRPLSRQAFQRSAMRSGG